MNWTTNSIVTLVAVTGTLISPIASAFFKWIETKNENNNKAEDRQLKSAQLVYEDLKTKYRDVFEDYITTTQQELVPYTFTKFSTRQKELQSLVYLYANQNVISSICNLNEDVRKSHRLKYDDDLLAIAKAFNLQWQTLQPKQN